MKFEMSTTGPVSFDGPINEEQRKEIERHKQYSRENQVDHFNVLARNYDSVMDKVGHPDPDLIKGLLGKIMS